MGKKSRGKTHGLRLILSNSDIFESLYSTDYISLMFTWNWLNAGYFTHVPKFCIGNLVKLQWSDIHESKLSGMPFFW